MASKKKPKPQFDVPEELESSPKAGWVYRSAAATKEIAAAKPLNIMPPPATTDPRPRSEPYHLAAAGAETVGHGLAAVGNIFLLGARLIALPMRVAIQFLSGR